MELTLPSLGVPPPHPRVPTPRPLCLLRPSLSLPVCLSVRSLCLQDPLLSAPRPRIDGLHQWGGNDPPSMCLSHPSLTWGPFPSQGSGVTFTQSQERYRQEDPRTDNEETRSDGTTETLRHSRDSRLWDVPFHGWTHFITSPSPNTEGDDPVQVAPCLSGGTRDRGRDGVDGTRMGFPVLYGRGPGAPGLYGPDGWSAPVPLSSTTWSCRGWSQYLVEQEEGLPRRQVPPLPRAPHPGWEPRNPGPVGGGYDVETRPPDALRSPRPPEESTPCRQSPPRLAPLPDFRQ